MFLGASAVVGFEAKIESRLCARVIRGCRDADARNGIYRAGAERDDHRHSNIVVLMCIAMLRKLSTYANGILSALRGYVEHVLQTLLGIEEAVTPDRVSRCASFGAARLIDGDCRVIAEAYLTRKNMHKYLVTSICYND